VIQSLYMKMKRDIWLREYDKFSQLADHRVIEYSLYSKLDNLINKIGNLITYQNNFENYLLEFYLYILSIFEYLFFLIRLIHYAMIPFLYICQGVDWLMSFILWLFCKFTIIPIKILINTFSFSQKIQRERVYFRQLKNYWHTFDGWTQEILVNSMSHNTQNIDASDGTGAIAGFITFFLGFIVLIIPPLSELFDKFITTNLKLVIELIFYHFSNYINHPNLYLVYVQCLDALEKFLGININWWQADTITSRLTILLTKLGILLTITILFFWIINPDKLYGKIETIRNSNFKKFSGMLVGRELSYDRFDLFNITKFENLCLDLINDDQMWLSINTNFKNKVLVNIISDVKDYGEFLDRLLMILSTNKNSQNSKLFSLFNHLKFLERYNLDPTIIYIFLRKIGIFSFFIFIFLLTFSVVYVLTSDLFYDAGCNFYLNHDYSNLDITGLKQRCTALIADNYYSASIVDKILLKSTGLIDYYGSIYHKNQYQFSLSSMKGILNTIYLIIIYILTIFSGFFIILFFMDMIPTLSFAKLSKKLFNKLNKLQKIRVIELLADYAYYGDSDKGIEGKIKYIHEKLFKDFEYLEIDQNLQKLFWQYYLSKYKKDHPELVQEIMDSFN